jgi:hypothetical protein
MARNRNPDADSPETKPQEARPHPNPREDLSHYSMPADEEENSFGPDGNGESPETDDEHQIARGAD